MKMVEGVFELEAAAADVFFLGEQNDLVAGFDGVAGFAGGLVVDFDLAGHDGALGFLAALAEAAFNHRLIQTQ